MKSQHRHELETNALAKRLDVAVERFRPYASTIAGVIIAVVVLMFLWSYFAGSSAARQTRAWDAFNSAVVETAPNIDQLRQAAQEHPGTMMQKMADVTWADAQVYIAARDYLYNRAAANEALTKALSAYQGVIQSSDDERLINRARFGIARVYEIQGKLEEARKAYLEVKGAFEELAKLQAERLAEPEAKATYDWLATARPQMRPPTGPGTPGQRPLFSADDLALPGTSTNAPAGSTTPENQSIEELLQGLKLDFGTPSGDDKYSPAGTEPAPEAGKNETGTEGSPPTETADQTQPAAESATPDNAPPGLPFGEPPTSGTPADPPPAEGGKAKE